MSLVSGYSEKPVDGGSCFVLFCFTTRVVTLVVNLRPTTDFESLRTAEIEKKIPKIDPCNLKSETR